MKEMKIKVQIEQYVLDEWQEIVDIAADIISVPAALIMRIDDNDIEVCLSSDSPNNPYHPGDRELLYGSGLYCERVIITKDKLLIPDALSDEHWKDNPDVKLNMISYLGFPILLPDKSPFGTICVLDNQSNEYSVSIEKMMLKFRNIIEWQIELIYMNQVLGSKNNQLVDYLNELQAFRGFVRICSNCKSIQESEQNWQPIENYLIKHPEADFSHTICPECMRSLYPDFFTDT